MAGNGPLPNPNRRRTNPPTIPTTKLPASGYQGEIPECPYRLEAAGEAWWLWAWRTPQASAWDPGSLYSLARRARLEDTLAALHLIDDFELLDLFAQGDIEARSRVEWALRTLKASASGALAVQKEMRELDDKFGLTAKGLAALRWTIVPDGADEKPAPRAARASTSRNHLRAVDPNAAVA